MIRVRIERYNALEIGANPEGLLWYEYGEPVGRAIIEAWNGELPVDDPLNWVSVEVIDAG